MSGRVFPPAFWTVGSTAAPMTEYEADVIEAAQDWAMDVEGGHYGPNAGQIKKSERRLIDAVSTLMGENEGRWKRP